MSTIRSLAGIAVLAGCLASVAQAAPTVREKPAKTGGYQFSSVLSLGGADADENSDFYERFGTVEVDADGAGNIYVLDNGNTRVQVFDAKGQPLRSLGREGDGPGEFRMPRCLSVNAGGDFAVFDMGQGRVTVIDAQGELLYDLLVQGMVENVVLTDERQLLLGFGKIGPAAVQMFDASGNVMWAGGKGAQPSGPQIKMEIGIQTVAPRLALLASGAAFRAPEGDYELQRFTRDDAAVFTRPLERRKFTEEELAPPSDEEGGAEVIMIRREGPGGGGDGGGSPGAGGGGGATFTTEGDGESHTFDLDRLRSMMPTHHSATRGILSWADGRVWVLTTERGQRGNLVDEWSEAGDWLRRFEMPEGYDWLQVGRDGRLYGVTHDEDDYPTVHRLDVQPGA